MFAHTKKFVIASLLATAVGTAAFAAPQYTAPQFGPTESMSTITLNSGDTQDTYINVRASELLDANDMILAMYTANDLSGFVNIKQVIAPEGIGITLIDRNLTNSGLNGQLRLEFEFTNANVGYASYPVQVVLENPKTGATYTLNLTVQTR